MYCNNCGRPITNSQVVYCSHCGAPIHPQKTNRYIGEPVNEKKQLRKQNKGGVGFFLGMFTFFWGLLVGVLMYPAGSEERRTFVKGWAWGFWALTLFSIAVVLIVVFVIFGTQIAPFFSR